MYSVICPDSSHLTINVVSPQNWILTAHQRFTMLEALEAQPGTSNSMEAAKLIDDDLKLINNDITILNSIKFSMLSQCNIFAPVSHLLPEILACIFSLFQVVEPPSCRDIRWIVITHVCCHWYQIAEEDGTLWANVTSVLGSQWMQNMLKCARAVPLNISHTQYSSTSEDEWCSTLWLIHSHLS